MQNFFFSRILLKHCTASQASWLLSVSTERRSFFFPLKHTHNTFASCHPFNYHVKFISLSLMRNCPHVFLCFKLQKCFWLVSVKSPEEFFNGQGIQSWWLGKSFPVTKTNILKLATQHQDKSISLPQVSSHVKKKRGGKKWSPQEISF